MAVFEAARRGSNPRGGTILKNMRLPTRKQVKAAIKDYWKTAGKPKKQKGKKLKIAKH